MTLDEENQIRLTRVCANCGEIFGYHRLATDNCPFMEDGRIAFFQTEQNFKEWIDEQV